MTRNVVDEQAMLALGHELAEKFVAGDVVLLSGELGAGKTTLVRGILSGLGWKGEVRSPTFNLIQTYETAPPVLHADLYRLKSADGLGLEEESEGRLCLIEWPDRLGAVLAGTWQVEITFAGNGRNVSVSRL